jgi:Ca2+-binding EF-hand superfamily protein
MCVYTDSGTLEAPEIHAELLALQQPLTLAEVVALMSEVDTRNTSAVDFSQFKVNNAHTHKINVDFNAREHAYCSYCVHLKQCIVY